MKYTNLCLLILLLFLSGCQFVPEMGSTGDQSENVTEATEEHIRSKNPYLTNRPSVPSDVKERFQAANKAMAAQQWLQAEQALQWLTSHYFELSGPWVNLALVYKKLDKADRIEPAFQQAIKANASNTYAHNQYALYLREQGRFTDAETSYRHALDLWPDYPDAHLNLAILYDLYMGKLEPALEHYQYYQGLQAEPDRRIAGWIIDTQRRINTAAKE